MVKHRQLIYRSNVPLGHFACSYNDGSYLSNAQRAFFPLALVFSILMTRDLGISPNVQWLCLSGPPWSSGGWRRLQPATLGISANLLGRFERDCAAYLLIGFRNYIHMYAQKAGLLILGKHPDRPCCCRCQSLSSKSVVHRCRLVD